MFQTQFPTQITVTERRTWNGDFASVAYGSLNNLIVSLWYTANSCWEMPKTLRIPASSLKKKTLGVTKPSKFGESLTLGVLLFWANFWVFELWPKVDSTLDMLLAELSVSWNLVRLSQLGQSRVHLPLIIMEAKVGGTDAHVKEIY